MNSNITTKEKNPREKANIVSIITFAWFVPTFVKGYKKELEETDLFETLPEDKSSLLGDRLEEAWKREEKRRKPSLWRALIRIFIWKFVATGLATLVVELGFKIGQTLALGKLIYFYTPNQTKISKNEAYMYASIITLCSLCIVLFTHNNVMALQHLGMKVRVACCSLIYRKSLRLSLTALGETTIGQLTNLLSNDVNRFDYAVINIHNLWVAPLQVMLVMYLVYNEVGWTGIIGVLFIVMFIPMQIYLGRRSSILRLKVAIKTDERVRLMNEIISGIQVIKMYAWEKPFAKLVAICRRLEIKQVKGTSYIKGIILSCTNFITAVALFLTILTYVLLGNVVRAEYVFVITSFYNILRQSMTVYFPNGISQVAEASVSVQRLHKFLLREEIESERRIPLRYSNKNLQNGFTAKDSKQDSSLEAGILLQSACAKWTEAQSENTLSNINLIVGKSQLIAVIGSVGSGKTSLLNAILQELPLKSGTIKVTGKVSYASQDPWLFTGSVRENILFGQSFDEERYKTVVKVCALERDFSLFPYGDRCIVGERGVMLSGGQRARINLARAVYKQSDIYLLDDPLAAVDVHVGKQLFERCISEFLRGKCVILVTNQLQFLRSVDRIILIGSGSIVSEGTYQELQQSGLDFAKLLESDPDEGQSMEKLTKHSSVDVIPEDSDVPLLNKESRSSGTINKKVYHAYLKAGGRIHICLLLLLSFVIAQITASSTDYFLAYWTNLEQKRAEKNETGATVEYEGTFLTRETTVYIYAAIMSFCVFIYLTRSFAFFSFCMRSSTRLHDKMFSKVVKAPMRFFNLNSSGRILNRFSKDMGSIDESLPHVLLDTFQIGLKVLGITVVVSTINPWLLLVSSVILTVFYLLRIVYLATSRNVKRLEGVTRSPVFTHMNASLQGLTTIRAFGAEEMITKEFDNHQDQHSSAWFMFLGSSRTFGFWLDLICVFYIACVTLSFLLFEQEKYGGNVGLAITQSLMLCGMFQWGMRQWSELENQMTAVERVVEYTNLETEDHIAEDRVPPKTWPQHGRIEFVDVWMRYSIGDPYVLKNLNFFVNAEEKVGIVGRTGAGKSSLISAIFQLTRTEGQILIDGLNLTSYPLQSVRSKISIIPQEPVLFSGTLRKNLDPFEDYSDVELWNALEEVELKSVISETPAALHTKVSEGGTNFSVGQRQLLCLARAIVRKNKILVLDEATANVDPQTDALIQKTIRRKFASCTVLTIAHRLHTVMDSDKVLVMDAGRVSEFDHPYVLLNQKGLFYEMVQQTGKSMADNLLKIAEQNYKLKKIRSIESIELQE